MRPRWFQFLPIILVSLSVGGADAGAGPTSLTVFGDSLSDVGNLSQATGGFYPGSAYFDGRLSNGPIYAELLGFELAHSLAGGSDYAVANARTGDPLIGIATQLRWFAEANPSGADPGGLYVIWFGGNDVIDGYESGDPAAAGAAIAAALGALRQGLEDLLAMGVRQVAVLNLPDLSLAPDVLERGEPETSALAHALCAQWNAGLAQIVADTGEPEIELFDVFAWFQEVAADPAGAGFTNVHEQALSTGGDDDAFLFWDEVHPTAAAHRKLAGRMLAGLSALAVRQPVVVTSIRHDPATAAVRIVFQSLPGGRYVIEFSTALAGGWEVMESGFASQGEFTTYSSRADSGRGFYRIFRSR